MMAGDVFVTRAKQPRSSRNPERITAEQQFRALIHSGMSPEMAAVVTSRERATGLDRDPGTKFGYRPEWAVPLSPRGSR
jgi:hypothetical protein